MPPARPPVSRLDAVGGWLRGALAGLRIRLDRSPIATMDALADFARTRAAHVGQTSLFGYLKTRMGLRYPTIFQDPRFAPALDAARARIFAACLSDICVFAAATLSRALTLGNHETAAIARACFARSLSASMAEAPLELDEAAERSAFAARAANVPWASTAIGEAAFTFSPRILIEAAPVEESIKALDAAIVENSIRFRWREARAVLRRRIDPAAIRADFASQPGRWTDDGR